MSEPNPSENSQPTPDSEKSQSPAVETETSTPERDGFFRRVRRNLNPETTHPSEEQEIVVMDDDNDRTQFRKV